jgi:homoserine kinase
MLPTTPSRSILVEAPASSANLGPGFDVFALALQRPSDRLRLDVKQSEKLLVRLKVVGGEGLPSKVSQNVASAVAQAIGRTKGIRANLSITLYKGVRPGVGLGSSAASAVAATVAMDRLFNLSLEEEEAIRFSGEGERVATGSRHYDNASASLLGGFVVVGKGG